MFYHVKELQFNARVSKPDPAFATLLLEQFGGANGELAAALRYFGQAFGAKKPYPDKYDLLMDSPVWMYASHLSGMYIENSIWMKDPPASSYPACIAVKCAQLQSAEYGEQYLRLLRESVMLKGINIAKHEVLIELANELAKGSKDFNSNMFQQHLFGKEGIESFKIDMHQVKNYNISRFPTLIIRSKQQQPVLITGYRPYDVLVKSLHQISPDIKATQKAISEKEYKSYWSTITDREIEEALK